MYDKNSQDPYGVLRDLNRSKEEKYAYEAQLKQIMDEGAKLSDAKYLAKKKGVEEGFKEGLEQAMIKIAGKMIARGDSNKEIMDMTDLTLEEVETLRVNN